MKTLITILLLSVSAISFAESGFTIHALNIGYGRGDPVTSQGFGVAYKNFHADYRFMPDSEPATTLSYSANFQFGALRFGTYTGISNNMDFLAGYTPNGALIGMYYQPYVRFGDEFSLEFRALKGGASMSISIMLQATE